MEQKFMNLEQARNYMNSKEYKNENKMKLGKAMDNVAVQDDNTNEAFLGSAITLLAQSRSIENAKELAQLLTLRIQGYSTKRLGEFFKTDPKIIEAMEHTATKRVKDLITTMKVKPVILDSGTVAKG